MKTKLIALTFMLVVLTFLSSFTYSQEKPTGHLFEMNYLSIPYEQMEDFMQFYETAGKPLDAQNEFVLSVKILRHVSGPSWNICFISEYKDMESFAKAQKRGDEIFEKLNPDKSKRDEIMKKWMTFMKGHTDALVMDNPGLEKTK